jgi:hypothetical protein
LYSRKKKRLATLFLKKDSFIDVRSMPLQKESGRRLEPLPLSLLASLNGKRVSKKVRSLAAVAAAAAEARSGE